MYTCGPTVYDFAHVGNFRAFLTYDLIKRVLLYFGYEVTHICNLTDVDDKIINRANEQGIEVITDLTLKYERLFFDDLKALNIQLATRYPRATEHITEMMDMIEQLAEKGLAYETPDGSWYFATDQQPNYGTQLVQLNVEDMETSERSESEGKRNAQDFCLWKAFKPDVDREDAAWESDSHKIQKGRPGWHLECSAMARKYLGDTIDLHGGGIDLKFPHHENEIAQSEGVSGGKTFCNCWMHNGFVNINDEKMSKSLGNFLTLRTACPQPILVRSYRYLVMSSQYRNPLSFTANAMDGAKNALNRIDKVRQQVKQVLVESKDKDRGDESVGASELATKTVPAALQNFEAALMDDLSMPRATASFFGLVKSAETELKRGDKGLDVIGLMAIDKAIEQMDQVFGIFYQVPLADGEESKPDQDEDDDAIPEAVLELVVKRTEAKEAKDWELADSLRSRIADLGFVVKDVKDGEPIVNRVG
jgi:cysteinyl-tRNA synthetase